jgi:hypothetical protein
MENRRDVSLNSIIKRIIGELKKRLLSTCGLGKWSFSENEHGIAVLKNMGKCAL